MQAWDNFLHIQEIELGIDTVKKWLRPLKVLRFDACNLYLEANDSFQILWFEEHLRKKVVTGFKNNNQKSIKVHLSLSNQKSTQGPKTKKESEKKNTPPSFVLQFDQMDPNCTLKNFVETAGTQLPYKVACELVTSSRHEFSFNPMYCYGPSGCGKTHLLMALAHALHAQGKKVLYCRAETFTQHVVLAIRSGEMSQFRQAYRNVDALVIDDIDVFARKAATQEEFFHTFNTLHMAQKTIILASCRAPGELEHIEPRLISRFEWGIALPLAKPSKQEISIILTKKAAALSVSFNPKIIEFVVETFSSSCKAAVRALEALILRAHINQQTAHHPMTMITVAMANACLSDLIQEESSAALNATQVLRIISETFGVHHDDILSKSKSRDCVLPRQIAMYLCRKELKMPFTKIGDLFNRDHSTVMTSVKLIQKGINNSEESIIEPYHHVLKKLKT